MDIFLSDFSPTQKICRDELSYSYYFPSFDCYYDLYDSDRLYCYIYTFSFWDGKLNYDIIKSTNLIFWHVLKLTKELLN